MLGWGRQNQQGSSREKLWIFVHLTFNRHEAGKCRVEKKCCLESVKFPWCTANAWPARLRGLMVWAEFDLIPKHQIYTHTHTHGHRHVSFLTFLIDLLKSLILQEFEVGSSVPLLFPDISILRLSPLSLSVCFSFCFRKRDARRNPEDATCLRTRSNRPRRFNHENSL